MSHPIFTAALPLTAINTSPVPLEFVDMDMLPFPLLISHCLGVWLSATTEKLPCLLLFYMHAFHKVIITSWRAEGLTKSNFSQRFTRMVVDSLHLILKIRWKFFPSYVSISYIGDTFVLHLLLMRFSTRMREKSSFLRVVTSLDDRTLILKLVLLKMFLISKVGKFSWMWLLAREALDFSKL